MFEVNLTLGCKYNMRLHRNINRLINIDDFFMVEIVSGMGVPRLGVGRGSLWAGVVLLALTCGGPTNADSAEDRIPLSFLNKLEEVRY